MTTSTSTRVEDIGLLLSSPRSGSTLLRLMLAGHPRLFCPPELNLLPFESLSRWNETLGSCVSTRCIEYDCDQREGLEQALVELTKAARPTDADVLRDMIDRNASVQETYATLARLAAPRRLIDKSPLNASSIQTLTRAELIFEQPRYLHLVRDPRAVVESLARNGFDEARTLLAVLGIELPGGDPIAFAEQIWIRTNRSLLDFSEEVEPHRWLRVRFEDLVSDPRAAMERVATFFDVDFDERLVQPYEGQRMAEGLRPGIPAAGDPNILEHDGIDPSLASGQQGADLALSPEAIALATELGYADIQSTSATKRRGGRWWRGIMQRACGCSDCD